MNEKLIKFFDFVIYWTIILFPFAMAIAPAPANVFMGWLYFSFIMKKILKKERIDFERNPITLPFLALFIVSAISVVNSIDYSASIRGLFKLVQYFFIFIILAEELKDKAHLKKIMFMMICGIGLVSIDAIWQVFSGHDFIRGNEPIINIGLKRATASFPNANVLGVYLSAIIPLFTALILYYFKGRLKPLLIGIWIITLGGVLLTFSRPAILAVYLAILMLAIIKKDKRVIIVLILLVLVSPLLAPKSLKDWAKEIHYNPIIFMCNHDRIAVYLNALNMISHHPIIGVGVNTFSHNYTKYKIPEVEKKWAITGPYMYAHNNFLHMAGEIGLLGLTIFIWLLSRIFKGFQLTQRFIKDNFIKIIHLGLVISIISFLINGLTETSLYYSRVCMIFWFLIGLLLGIKRLQDEVAKQR